MPKGEMIHKTFDAYIVKAERINDKEGIVEAVVNTFGIVDKAIPPDIVHPGTFTKTIQERFGKVRVLDNHRTDSVKAAIGRPLEMQEIGRSELPPDLLAKNPTATGGLRTKTLFMLNDPDSLAVFNRLEANVINEFSIGFQVVKSDWSKESDPETGKEITVRNVREAILFEYSAVLWGASETATLGVKSVVPKQDLPLADRGRAWDASAAEGRIRAWAGGEDDMDWAKYRKAFMWFDSENSDQFGAYKLGYADIIDGTLTAIPRGIFAIAGVLQGARGGVNIPDADQDRIKGIVSRWYAQMRNKFDDDQLYPPWDENSKENEPVMDTKEPRADGQPIQRLGDFLFGAVYAEIMFWSTMMLMDGFITSTEMAAVMSVSNELFTSLQAALGEDCWNRALNPQMLDQMLSHHPNLKRLDKHATLNSEDQQQAPEDPLASEAEPPSEALTSTRDQDDQLMRLRLLKLQSQSMEGRDAFTETRPPGGNSAT